jgi:hypothetical protein
MVFVGMRCVLVQFAGLLLLPVWEPVEGDASTVQIVASVSGAAACWAAGSMDVTGHAKRDQGGSGFTWHTHAG